MNLLQCLIPKKDVLFINDDVSLFSALSKMQTRNYEAIPIISKSGKYFGTITSGDILGFIKENYDLSLRKSAEVPIKNVRRTRDNKSVNANAKITNVIEMILEQNFVPVVDDDSSFIGIVTRREIIKHLHGEFLKHTNS